MAYIGNQPVPEATQTRDSFTATASQTTFTTSQGYSVGFIDVFMNGVRLTGSDFTATDGSTVVLASGAAAGDLIDIIAYSTFTPFVGAIDGIPIGGTTPAAGTFTTLDTTGNLGVGTATTNLSSSNIATTIDASAVAGYSAVELAGNGTLNYHINANNAQVYHVVAGTRGWNLWNNGAATITTDSSQNVSIPNGNLGIGTTPSYPLHVQTSATTTLANYFNSNSVTSGTGFQVNASGLTSGTGSYFYSNSATQSGSLVFIENDHASANGVALTVQNDGTGNGVFIDQNGDGTGLVVDHEGVATNAINATSTTTGGVINVTNSGAGQCFRAQPSATGYGYFVNGFNITTGRGMDITVQNITTGWGLLVYSDSAAFTSGNGLAQIKLDNASSAGTGLVVTNDGTGNGVFIDQNGNGRGLVIDSEATTERGMLVQCDAKTSGELAWFYTNSAVATGRGVFIEIDHASASCNGLQIQQDGTGDALFIDNNGSGSAIFVNGGNIELTNGQYIEEYNATGTSGAVTIDCNTGNSFATNMAGAVTYTFTNPAASGRVSSFTLNVINNGSAITWPASVDWPAGTAPTLSASGATDVFVFYTHDGGTTWYGFTAGQGMA